MNLSTSTKSFIEAIARSGCPRRDAVVAAPLVSESKDKLEGNMYGANLW